MLGEGSWGINNRPKICTSQQESILSPEVLVMEIATRINSIRERALFRPQMVLKYELDNEPGFSNAMQDFLLGQVGMQDLRSSAEIILTVLESGEVIKVVNILEVRLKTPDAFDIANPVLVIQHLQDISELTGLLQNFINSNS